jgi:hypothetical protein
VPLFLAKEDLDIAVQWRTSSATAQIKLHRDKVKFDEEYNQR